MATNHLGEKEYGTYASWKSAAKKAGATRFEGDKDMAEAFNSAGKSVGQWEGDVGNIRVSSAASFSRVLVRDAEKRAAKFKR